MPIDQFIVHRISHQAGADTQLRFAPRPLPLDDGVQQLADSLKGSFFSRIGRQHGSFESEGEPSPLASGLQAYADKQQDLLQLSSGLLEVLKDRLAGHEQDLDCHVVCFTEKQGDGRMFYLLFAGHKTALAIGEDLAVRETSYLDLGPSLFGIKADLTEWLHKRHYAYLSLLAPSRAGLAEIVRELMGFEPGLDKADSTETFLAGVEAFAGRLPEERQAAYREQVVGYCTEREQCDAAIDLRELGAAMEGIDGDDFARFMADYTPEDDERLMMDRRSLRRYVKFTGRERDLAISFAASQLNSRVHYNPDRDSLSIDGIPRALREQLLRHLNK